MALNKWMVFIGTDAGDYKTNQSNIANDSRRLRVHDLDQKDGSHNGDNYIDYTDFDYTDFDYIDFGCTDSDCIVAACCHTEPDCS